MAKFVVSERGYREADMALVFRARMVGLSVDELIVDAKKIRAFMDSTASGEVPDWSHVSAMADVTAERDRARENAARLERLLEEKEGELGEARKHLATGVLMQVRHQAEHTLTEAGQIAIRRAVAIVAARCGVQL